LKKTSNITLLSLAVIFSGSQARAAAPEAAWNAAQGFDAFVRQTPAALPQSDAQSVPGTLIPTGGPADGFVSIQAMSLLPSTDPKTAAWLASRIPGLNTSALRTVPADSVDAVMSRAAAARASYLDIFTDPGLGHGNPDLYYLSQAVLEQVNAKWVSGTLPVSGTTTDGHPFHMQGLVAGNGSVYILYDLMQFNFKDGSNQFGITDNGRVTVSVLGKADVGVAGVRAHGCKGIFCGWADIQRITKTGAGSVKVKTSRGDQNAGLDPVHLR
jgi:hypothetical protein